MEDETDAQCTAHLSPTLVGSESSVFAGMFSLPEYQNTER